MPDAHLNTMRLEAPHGSAELCWLEHRWLGSSLPLGREVVSHVEVVQYPGKSCKGHR